MGPFDDYDVKNHKLGAAVTKRNEKLLNGIAAMNLGDVREHDTGMMSQLDRLPQISPTPYK